MSNEYRKSLENWVRSLTDAQIDNMLILPDGKLSAAEYDAVFFESVRRLQGGRQ